MWNRRKLLIITAVVLAIGGAGIYSTRLLRDDRVASVVAILERGESRESVAAGIASLAVLANAGDADAQYVYGSILAFGQMPVGPRIVNLKNLGDFQPDAVTGYAWVEKAARQDHPAAAVAMWSMPQANSALAARENESETWLRRAAALGDAAAQRELGYLLLDRAEANDDYFPDVLTAMWLIRKAAYKGDVATVMGFTRRDSAEKTRDYFKATRKLDDLDQREIARLARANDIAAKFRIATRIVANIEPLSAYEVSNSEVIGWLKELAEGGSWLVGPYQLYQLYLQGNFGPLSVEPSESEALKWLEMAANYGSPIGLYDYGRVLLDRRLGTDVEPEIAVAWIKLAADQDVEEAQHELAICLEHGRGIWRSNELALKNYRAAADYKYLPAIERLIEVYERGELGQKPDPEMVRAYAEKKSKAEATEAERNSKPRLEPKLEPEQR